MTFLPENSSTEIARLKIASWEHATFHSQVWNRRQFVPRASFKTKTTTKALIGFHNPYFWILRHLFQPISIVPGIQSEENQGLEKKGWITPVVCQEYQTLPQNYTPAVAAHFWQTSSHFFLFPWGWIMFYLLWKEIWWEERYGLAYLSQLPCN